MSERPIIVNRGIIQEDDTILLVKRAADDSYAPECWELPGGKVNEDERHRLQAALYREVHEETGFEIESDPYAIWSSSQILNKGKYAGRRYTAHVWLCRVIGGSLMLSYEHEDASWPQGEEALNFRLTDETRRALLTTRPVWLHSAS